jgi:hypothetical protein
MRRPFSKKQLEKLVKQLEVKIYNNGLYSKMCGSWDISCEIDEDEFDEYLDEHEKDNDWIIPVNVTATCYEEDGGHSDWWNINVFVDKDCNIKKIEAN